MASVIAKLQAAAQAARDGDADTAGVEAAAAAAVAAENGMTAAAGAAAAAADDGNGSDSAADAAAEAAQGVSICPQDSVREGKRMSCQPTDRNVKHTQQGDCCFKMKQQLSVVKPARHAAGGREPCFVAFKGMNDCADGWMLCRALDSCIGASSCSSEAVGCRPAGSGVRAVRCRADRQPAGGPRRRHQGSPLLPAGQLPPLVHALSCVLSDRTRLPQVSMVRGNCSAVALT